MFLLFSIYGSLTISEQAFINTAKEIYQKIQEGVFDINNEVDSFLSYLALNYRKPYMMKNTLYFVNLNQGYLDLYSC